MNWRYYIPHDWPESGRTTWEDIFILPDDPSYSGEALWLTINCLGEPPGENSGVEPSEWAEAAAMLGDAPYRVSDEADGPGIDMIVRGVDFSEGEFLEWVKEWLRVKGIAVSELVPAPLEDFAGRLSQADFILRLIDDGGQ